MESLMECFPPTEAEDIGHVDPLVGGTPANSRGHTKQTGRNSRNRQAQLAGGMPPGALYIGVGLFMAQPHFQEAATENPKTNCQHSRGDQRINPEAQANKEADASPAPSQLFM